MLVLYINADSISNKINELRLVVNSLKQKLSVIAITEVKHKSSWQTSRSELTLSGYDLHSNDLQNSPRGILIYVNSSGVFRGGRAPPPPNRPSPKKIIALFK